MASWQHLVDEAPEFAARARAILDANLHKTLATLRRDGSPRISGIETVFAEGEVWLGMMSGSLKARDLQRDPRLALHSASIVPNPGEDDGGGWMGDAKLAGRGIEETDPARIRAVIGEGHEASGAHLFRLDLTEVVVVGLNDARDAMVIESWHEGRGLSRTERT